VTNVKPLRADAAANISCCAAAAQSKQQATAAVVEQP